MTARNISLLGATYSAVPAVTLPISGGGTATFHEISDTTAAADTVLSGYYIYTAAGVKTQGSVSFSTVYTSSSNPSGGNNGDIWLKTV